MDTGGRLIAGSHNRNEFVLINADENARVRRSKSPKRREKKKKKKAFVFGLIW